MGALFTINSTTGNSGTLVIEALDTIPGIINLSSFTAYLGYHVSVSGHCTPSVVSSGNITFCTATFSYLPQFGTLYKGTFKAFGNYCPKLPSNASCLQSNAFAFDGFISIQATKAPIPVPQVIAKNYVAINITNSQTIATPSPFQQMLTVNSAAYAKYEAGNLQNVEFFYSNGTIIPSWLESGNSNTSTSSIYWLKLAKGIPAGSTITIYMGFAPISENLFNSKTIGEAPQLSSTYGQYDNGANVFNFYDNFAGTTLSSKWSTAGNAATVTVNNGLTLSGSSSAAAGIVTTSTISFPVVIETYNKVTTQSLNSYMIATVAAENIYPQSGSIYWQLFDYDYRSSSFYESDYYWNGGSWSTITQGNYVYSTTSYYVTSAIVGSSSYNGYLNYTKNVLSTTSSIPSGNLYLALVTAATNNYIYWLRTRSYPPNGVMPSVVFGSTVFSSPIITTSTSTSSTICTSTTSTSTSVSTTTSTSTTTSIAFTTTVSYYYSNVTITNTQPSTVAPFQQMLTVNSLTFSAYEANNLQNVYFTYLNGTIIPSWLESGNSN
ncbi:MAG: hypothetical protein QW045_02760, partial [Candidatus Micrarchaeaceae archaeon]